MKFALRSRGGAWSEPRTITQGENRFDSSVLALPDGSLAAYWHINPSLLFCFRQIDHDVPMEAYELVRRLFFKQESANYRRSGGCCCDSTIAWYTIVRNSAISRTSVGSFCVIRMPMSCSFGSMKKLVEANPAQSYAPSEPMR